MQMNIAYTKGHKTKQTNYAKLLQNTKLKNTDFGAYICNTFVLDFVFWSVYIEPAGSGVQATSFNHLRYAVVWGCSQKY